MNENAFKYVFLYKKGSITQAGIRDMRKAGFTCVQVNGEFSDVSFRAPVGGFGFEDEAGDMQIMVLKAALESYNFGDKLGALVVGAIKGKVKEAERKRVAAVTG